MDVVKFFYRPLTVRAARRGLVGRLRDLRTPEKGRFTRTDIDGFLRIAWDRYRDEAGSLPPQPTFGSTMNVRLACFTNSFFNTLLASGSERKYAIELVADAAWSIYRIWARIALTIAHLTPSKTTTLGFAVTTSGKQPERLSLRFPFNAPGYLIEPAPSESGIAFDVVRCPIAEYFRKQAAVDLCLASWCNLDYPLSELTHEKLVRARTLVEGYDGCDFRLTPLQDVSHETLA